MNRRRWTVGITRFRVKTKASKRFGHVGTLAAVKTVDGKRRITLAFEERDGTFLETFGFHEIERVFQTTPAE